MASILTGFGFGFGFGFGLANAGNRGVLEFGKFGPHVAGGGLRFPAFSWPATQFCMLNRPAPGEHLGNQSIIL